MSISANQSLTVTQANSFRFKSEGVTCFTLADGMIIGRRYANGKQVPFAISVFAILRQWLPHCNSHERKLIKRLIEEAEE